MSDPLERDADWLSRYGPEKNEDGTARAEHYRLRLRELNRTNEALIREQGKAIPNFLQSWKAIMEEAQLAGLSPDGLTDTRSVFDQASDFMRGVRETPDAVFELLDQQLASIERAMDQCDSLCRTVIEEMESEAQERYIGAVGKWRALLRRVARLKARVRNASPGPVELSGMNHFDAAHLGRFMAYVGRSNISGGKRGGSGEPFVFARHHAVMLVNLWMAMNGVVCTHEGMKRGQTKYDGCILVTPPRHGKSELGNHWDGLEICKNPRVHIIVGHAREKNAQANVEYVKRMFSLDNPVGRRCYALFGLMMSRTDRRAGTMRIVQDQPLRDPTLSAHGMSAAISGVNADRVKLDDPVDQDEAESPTERDRTFNRVQGTWFARLQGQSGFRLVLATLWHKDDAVSRLIGLTEQGKARYRVSIQACGGPSSSPPYKAVWPEMYGPDYLRAKFNEMRNPRLYAASFMCCPTSDEARLIRRLRYWAPDRAHAEFVRGARMHLSVDPAASTGKGADKAGLVLVAEGQARVVESDENGRMWERMERQARVIDAWEFHATQTDLVDRIAAVCASMRIDEVHVEVVAGLVATAEMLENRYGVRAVRHTTRNRSKEQRLRGVASMLEDGYSSDGVRAVVLFPGREEFRGPQRVVVPEESKRWLFEQVLDFGVAANDHCLDALTQVLGHLAPQIGVGRGEVSRLVAGATGEELPPHRKRMLEILAEFERGGVDSGVSVEVEDERFLMGMARGG